MRKVDIEYLETILDKYKVFHKNIIIEIKESIITNTDVYNKIMKLSEAGFLIALDEYSNNNSSLTYLVDLEVDILKLDESLLEKIDSHQEYTRMHSIYKFMVDIGKKFDLTIVSTGVKKKEHLKLVRDLDIYINILDGYYLKGDCSNEFSNIINQLSYDSDYYKASVEMSKSGSCFYSADHVLKRWYDLYSSISNGRVS